MERFYVSYRIFASNESEALKRAEGIALEQTVEIPRDVVPSGYIEDTIMGKVEDIEYETGETFTANISYSPDSAGDELPQLINVIFGNSSIQKGLKVIGFELGEEMSKRFPCARFGIKGIRERANKAEGGLISPVIKPQGSSADTLAEISYRCALAGAEIIKDDHGLTNQHMAPFQERVEKICIAVEKANKETSGSTLYFPNIAGHSKDLQDYARFAKDAGAGGVLVMPGLFGFDLINRLVKDKTFDLPIMAHPSFLGPYVLSPDTGLTHAHDVWSTTTFGRNRYINLPKCWRSIRLLSRRVPVNRKRLPLRRWPRDPNLSKPGRGHVSRPRIRYEKHVWR